MDGSGPNARVPEASGKALLRDEVHLWWGRSGEVESLDGAWAWLSVEERRRSERFLRERDAHAFVFRRAFLRRVLARYVGCGPGELAFEVGPFGKPSLAGLESLAFNSSSRAGLVLIGVTAGRAIGVDLELHPSPWASDAEEIARLARRVATLAERRRLLALPPPERARAFLVLWTRKEALLKALGTGLSREPATVEVGWGPDEGRTHRLAGDLEPRWLALEAPEGCLASAVVGARPGEELAPRLIQGAGLAEGAPRALVTPRRGG